MEWYFVWLIQYESWEWVRKLFLVDLAEDVICIFSVVLLVAIVFTVIVFAKNQFYFRFIFVFPVLDQLDDPFWTWVSVTFLCYLSNMTSTGTSMASSFAMSSGSFFGRCWSRARIQADVRVKIHQLKRSLIPVTSFKS